MDSTTPTPHDRQIATWLLFCAAVIFSVLTEAFRPLEETLGMHGLGEILMALILILILIYRPGGLFGTREPAFLSVSARRS